MSEEQIFFKARVLQSDEQKYLENNVSPGTIFYKDGVIRVEFIDFSRIDSEPIFKTIDKHIFLKDAFSEGNLNSLTLQSDAHPSFNLKLCNPVHINTLLDVLNGD